MVVWTTSFGNDQLKFCLESKSEACDCTLLYKMSLRVTASLSIHPCWRKSVSFPSRWTNVFNYNLLLLLILNTINTWEKNSYFFSSAQTQNKQNLITFSNIYISVSNLQVPTDESCSSHEMYTFSSDKSCCVNCGLQLTFTHCSTFAPDHQFNALISSL